MEAGAKGIEAGYRAYLKAGKFKCPKSPVGAHHWVALSTGSNSPFRCKYCHKKQAFAARERGFTSINLSVSGSN